VQRDPLDGPTVRQSKEVMHREELSELGRLYAAWGDPFVAKIKYGGLTLEEGDDSDLEEGYAELPRHMEEMFYRALGDYYDNEAWKPNLPLPGGRVKQPYVWQRAIECVRAAHNRHQREEQIKQQKIRQQQNAE
jgi:hypothetical protein